MAKRACPALLKGHCGVARKKQISRTAYLWLARDVPSFIIAVVQFCGMFIVAHKTFGLRL